MKKKIIGIFVVMLLISSALTTILLSSENQVKASGGQSPGGGVNLDYDWVWKCVQNFSWVINRTDWSDENNIPKGRCWATAGENYTRREILYKNMGVVDNPCGLTGYTNLSIDPLQSNLSRQYSSKIIVKDYGLSIKNNNVLYRVLPYSEMFPMAVGNLSAPSHSAKTYTLTYNYSFNNAKVVRLFYLWQTTSVYYNVSYTHLFPQNSSLIGQAMYVPSNETFNSSQPYTVYIMEEEPSCEQKLACIDETSAAILIENKTRTYTFSNQSLLDFPLAKVSHDDDNLTTVLNEIAAGYPYTVESITENTILVFSNMSENASILPGESWVGILKLGKPSEVGGSYAKFLRIIALQVICRISKYGQGIILSDFNNDTYFMTHSVHEWGWFRNSFGDRQWVPLFSVNNSIGRFLWDNHQTATVTGFIDQEYRQQTTQNPGVISHNVVAYRNTTNSPNNAIAVLSNRMDGWWGATPGDSGVGGAILLGIAKYFHDNNITPKYNLTFLFTTGEEYGMRGVQHFVDSHPKNHYNFLHFIGFDQLGFNYTESQKNLTLGINALNATTRKIIDQIEKITSYTVRSGGYNFEITLDTESAAEDYVWKNVCNNTIAFGKDTEGIWDGYHRSGMNYTKGDSLNNIDRRDVNATFELAWNITKYFTVNPDCWFDNVTFTVFDSPNDGDTLNDSIRANFTIHSVLPSDKVQVELNLSFEVNGVGGQNPTADYVDYLLTSRSQNVSYMFTIPDSIVDGYYNISFKLYNSTGHINKIVYSPSGSYYNDMTNFSGWFHLYHPFGYTKIGDTYKCVDDNISGSVFTANEYGTAENITVYIDQNFVETTNYKCMLYRVNDSVLIGTTTENWFSLGGEAISPWWAVFNFTGTKPQLIKGTDYVITCWSDSAASQMYYSESGISGTGRYDAQSYGTPPDPAEFTNESRYYSIYCGYTPDITRPQIIDVTVSPHTVGFGYNVTVTANVTDECSGIDQVTVQIGYPDGKTGNFTMTHSSNDTYLYMFNDTWLVGQYNYTIWVMDNASNMNSSTGHHFYVSADASISIATLQDSYSGSQYINITDPPNPPENYTLVDRGLTWNTYYNATSGQNILETYQGPVNYQEDNDTWTPINNTIAPLPSNHPAYVYGYRSGNNHGLYGVYFKSNAQQEWPVAFTYNKSDDPTIHAIRSKLVGVGYVDPTSDWAYEYLQSVQSSQGQTNNYSITYSGVFTGTDVTWSYGNTGLKEEITLSNTTKTVLQNHPPSQYSLNDTSSYLVFITKLDYQNLNLYNGSGMLNGNVTVSDAGINFKDVLGQFKCALPLGEAYELNNESMREKLIYRIVHLNGNTYLLSGLKLANLNVMTFPVVIDPTLSVNSLYTDGFIYNSSSRDYTTVWEAPSGTIDSSSEYLTIGQKKAGFPISSYYVYRSYVLFNTTSLPANAYLDSAILSLYKRDDYSTTDFDLTIQNGQPTYPQNPLREGDYDKDHYSGDGGSYNTAYFVNGRNNISITEHGWINDQGITKLCLRSSRDINGNAPTGNEYINVYSTNAPLGAYVPKLIITYRNQSKIKNTGSTDTKGYLLIQVQFYNTSQAKWLLDNDTINETSPRTIISGNQLALDTIFNGHIRASDLIHGTGTYRVYVAFRSPDGNILKTNDERELVAWWEFSKT